VNKLCFNLFKNASQSLNFVNMDNVYFAYVFGQGSSACGQKSVLYFFFFTTVPSSDSQRNNFCPYTNQPHISGAHHIQCLLPHLLACLKDCEQGCIPAHSWLDTDKILLVTFLNHSRKRERYNCSKLSVQTGGRMFFVHFHICG
jgi:hypothetical protein